MQNEFTPKGRQTLPAEARRLIEEQTANFLKRGGEIQQVPNGVTGQVKLAGPRHIVLAKKPGDPAVHSAALTEPPHHS